MPYSHEFQNVFSNWHWHFIFRYCCSSLQHNQQTTWELWRSHACQITLEKDLRKMAKHASLGQNSNLSDNELGWVATKWPPALLILCGNRFVEHEGWDANKICVCNRSQKQTANSDVISLKSALHTCNYGRRALQCNICIETLWDFLCKICFSRQSALIDIMLSCALCKEMILCRSELQPFGRSGSANFTDRIGAILSIVILTRMQYFASLTW